MERRLAEAQPEVKGLGQRLSRFFYAGYSEQSLGLFRLYFGCLLLLYHIPQFATLFAIDPGGPAFHYTDPIWYFELLGIERTIPWLSLLAGLLLFASTLSMTLGKWTRTSIVLVLIAIFYLKGVRDSAAGDVHHRYIVLVQILFFLLLSRCGEAGTGRVDGKSARLLEWEASWPIRATQVYVAFFYFFALVAKLRVSGWDWFFDGGGRLQEQLIVRSVRWGLSDEGEPLRNALSFHLAGIPLLVVLMGLFVIALELLFPLILFVRRNLIKLCFVACAFLFHVANYVLLDVNFLLYGLVLLLFFDLAEVRRLLADQCRRALGCLRRRAAAVAFVEAENSMTMAKAGSETAVEPNEGAVIYFDGVCVLCNGLVDFVMPRDRHHRFRYATLQSESGQRMLRQLGLPTDDLQTFILHENGIAHVKSTAALRVCRRLSGLWPLLHLLIAVPRPLRDAVYGWVGKRRYRFFGRRASCRMPSEEERRLFLE